MRKQLVKTNYDCKKSTDEWHTGTQTKLNEMRFGSSYKPLPRFHVNMQLNQSHNPENMYHASNNQYTVNLEPTIGLLTTIKHA